MTIWSGEIKELDKLYESFKGHLPDIVKEMEQLIRTDDANVVMLYSRRCLEVIVTDLCECELKRPRKTEPLKGIIDKLNSEEKVPSHIITSMHGLNSMSTYGTHPKDFDPEQVKPVLNNLAIIIRWYLKYKDFQITSSTKAEEEKHESKDLDEPEKVTRKPKKRSLLLRPWFLSGIVIIIIVYVVLNLIVIGGGNKKSSNEIDSADNQIYKEVKIGNQVWMAENLKTTWFNNGKLIPLVTDSTEWVNLKTPAYCWYDNDETTFGTTYGALYNWYAVNTGKLCPTGWHVPSDTEWTTLTEYLGGDSIAGDKLKEKDYLHWDITDKLGATNESGFTSLPGGFRGHDGGFYGITINGKWWSSTYNYSDALLCDMYYYFSWAQTISSPKYYGLSVRCIKD
jgi:uncharacterized protein (TIGR02145 family)